jgi:hypothetical protein
MTRESRAQFLTGAEIFGFLSFPQHPDQPWGMELYIHSPIHLHVVVLVKAQGQLYLYFSFLYAFLFICTNNAIPFSPFLMKNTKILCYSH